MKPLAENLTFDFEYEGVEYSADVTVYYSEDHNYGADADGHRGIYQQFIEDIEIDRIMKGDEVIHDWDEPLAEHVCQIASDKFFGR